MSTSASAWFTKAVFRWRTIACCTWSLLLTLPSLMAFRFIAESLMWRPWTLLPTQRSTAFLGSFLALMVAINMVYASTCTVKLPILKTRLVALWNVMHPGHFLIILLLMFLGALCSSCLTEFFGYTSGLWYMCEVNGIRRRFLNEYLLFSAAFGATFGFCYGCDYFFCKEYFLVFPSLQKNELSGLRSHLCSHLREGLVWTLKVLRGYYPLYYLCGSTMRSYVSNVMHLLPAEGPGLDCFSELLNLSLFLHLILLGSYMHLSWSFALRLFRTYQTQAVFFPVVATFSEENVQLLRVAMTSDFQLLKFLGFLDLYQLSLHSRQRRKLIFSLNTAGQPQVWDSVCKECLQIVRSLTQRLSLGVEKMIGDKTPDLAQSPTSLSNSGATAKGWPSLTAHKLVGTPGATRRHIFNEKARLWSYSPGHSVERIPVGYSSEQSVPSPTKLAITQVFSYICSTPKRLAERLKKKPFFIYFLNELPDATNQELFADCQLQVWAIASVSELAVASYTEDVYGVVQRSLTAIIESLIHLSQALDKHVKAPLSCSRSTKNVRIALEANGRYAVKTAVQTALFRLASIFSKERRSIHLSPDHHKYWNKFFNNNR